MKLNTIQPTEGATHAKRRVGRGIGSGLGKTGVAVTRVKSPAPAAFIKSVLKAVRCLCSVVFQSVVLCH